MKFKSTYTRALLSLCVLLCIHTVICSMRTALVASVSCNRLFMCSILRVAVFSFCVSSSLVGSTFHTNGSKEKAKLCLRCSTNQGLTDTRLAGKKWHSGPLLSNVPCLGSGDMSRCSKEVRGVIAGERLSVSVVSIPSPSSLAVDWRSLIAKSPSPPWL